MSNNSSGKDRSAQYDRVLSRLRKDLESAEHRSWDYLQEKIEEAVELELAAEEMTRDERSEEHTSELQSHHDVVCRLLLEKKKQ